MNIYTAIMKAADQIERRPELFSFSTGQVPRSDCGSTACALGWIGFFAGARAAIYSDVSREVLGVFDHLQVYRRLTDLEKGPPRNWTGGEWPHSSAVCARVLRLYAEKYHGDQKPTRRPDSALVADLMTRVMGERIPEDA